MTRQSLPDAGDPDPGRITCQQDFGHELTLARQQAGLTIREVAKASGIPVSTVGDYFAARHLPPARQPELLPSILAACQITDAGQVRRWLDALNRVRRAPGRPPAGGPAPYRGLASFQPEDAAWFFGREELVLHLVRLATGPGAPGMPLAVVGPSGSGKSSVLRAGLVPRLRAGSTARPGGRPVVLITPGAAPLPALAGYLAPLAWPGTEGPLRAGLLAQGLREDPGRYARLAGRGDEPPAIIVDQLEEIFTAGADETGRREFVTALSALSEHTLVVLGLRADFYGHALGYPGLARSLQERQIVIGPMSAGQPRRAIVEPAHKAGRGIEDGLVEVLLADMRPPGAPGPGGHEAGALPLLSHALLATWTRSRGGRLTVADYQASGGIRDAIAQTAEHAYATLDTGQQEAARQLFLRLVHVGDDGIQTRARLPLSDLPGDASAAAAVLERFVTHRLVTKDQAAAEITHEALLGAWPRLRGWIDADGEDFRVRRFIEVAAQAWTQAGRETAALLRGGQLALAAGWAGSTAHRDALSQDARNFVGASIAEERAQQAAQRRRTRRLRQLVAALTVLVLLTVGLAGYAFRQRQLLLTAQDPAQSRTVAIEADQVRANDPGLAAQLSVAAYDISHTQQARASLLESSGTPMAARMQDSAMPVQSVALAPGRDLLAVAAADGTLKLWYLAVPGRPALIGTVANLGAGHPLYTAAFSPDGRVLATAGQDREVRLWNVADPRHPVPLGGPLTGPGNTIYALAFSPDGRLLAAGSADKTVRLWDVSDPGHGVPAGGPLTGAAGVVDSVAFSPGGGELAAGSYDDKVWRWNITDPAKPVPVKRLRGATDWIMAVAYSPGGQVLAEAGSDDQVRLFNAVTGAPLGILPQPQPVTSLAWDGPGLLVAGDADGYARAWQVPPPGLITGSQVNSIAFSPSGGALAAGGAGLQLWNPAARALTASAAIPGAAPGDIVNAVAFSPGGNLLATGYADGRIQLWRRGPGLIPLGTAQPASAGGLVEFVAFSPDGKLLASGGDDGTVRLWDLTDPARPRQLAVIPDAHTYVFSVAFGRGGRVLAAASADDRVRLWNVADPAAPAQLGKALTGPSSTAYSVAFSPGGRVLAVGSADKDVRLWDVTDPARPHHIGPVLAGPAGHVYSVAFGPGGRTLAAADSAGLVWRWDTRASDAARAVCALAGQPLTRAEWRAYVPGLSYAPPCR